LRLSTASSRSKNLGIDRTARARMQRIITKSDFDSGYSPVRPPSEMKVYISFASTPRVKAVRLEVVISVLFDLLVVEFSLDTLDIINFEIKFLL